MLSFSKVAGNFLCFSWGVFGWVMVSEKVRTTETAFQFPQKQMAQIVTSSNNRFILQICFQESEFKLQGRCYLLIHMSVSKLDVMSWSSAEFKVLSEEFPVYQSMMLHVFEELSSGDILNPVCHTRAGLQWPCHQPVLLSSPSLQVYHGPELVLNRANWALLSVAYTGSPQETFNAEDMFHYKTTVFKEILLPSTYTVV